MYVQYPSLVCQCCIPQFCPVATASVKLEGESTEDDDSKATGKGNSSHQRVDGSKREHKKGTKVASYTDEQDDFTVEADTDSDVLLFHGVILRSQLVEMCKNKVFFDEAEGVSHLLT